MDAKRATELARKVRRARLEAGLTQAQLAGSVISVRTVSRIELGRVVPSRRVLAYIAERVGKPLEHFAESPDAPVSEAEVECLLRLAALRREQGDASGAIEEAERAAEAAGRLGSPSLAAWARLEIELARLASAASDRAVERVRGAIKAARAERAHEAAWWGAYCLAERLAALGRRAEAEGTLRDLMREIGDRAPEVRACCASLLARLRARDPGGRAADLLDAIGEADRQRSPAVESEVAEAAARHALARGRWWEAAWSASQALALRRLARRHAGEAMAHVDMAARLRADGDVVRAEEAYARARDLARAAGDALTEARALVGMAELSIAADRPERATPLLDAARSLLGAPANAPHQARVEGV